jgi:hypothetical protein
VWVPAVAAAGFEGLTFHDLKHTAGTTLVEEGVNVKTAQARLGHANPQTTLRIYAQATDRADRQAAERIGERSASDFARGMDAGWKWLAQSSAKPNRPLTCGSTVGAGGLDPPTSAL